MKQSRRARAKFATDYDGHSKVWTIKRENEAVTDAGDRVAVASVGVSSPHECLEIFWMPFRWIANENDWTAQIARPNESASGTVDAVMNLHRHSMKGTSDETCGSAAPPPDLPQQITAHQSRCTSYSPPAKEYSKQTVLKCELGRAGDNTAEPTSGRQVTSLPTARSSGREL
ncbi:unnamed protein product [Ceratitis capitata]|uniref:(Mediterranean fruit fly) hypothetical protein n=1 Tax=Ceratitis capitata TaxID=7213 RepID=A0A811VCB2_CERCA|nr:unnamed protein product [Ceratitis capitata]